MRAWAAWGLILGLTGAGLPAMAQIEVQEVTSPAGHRAWLMQDDSLPFVAIEILFQGGTTLDAPDRRGAIYMMTGLLEEGAGARDARAFSQAVEGLAAQFGFSASPDTVRISARMLSENREAAAALLNDALSQPRFDEDAIERVRAQVLSGLARQSQDPDWIAGATFAAQAYGTHPYASAEEGTPETVAALTQDDMIAAHRATLVTGRAHIGAAGDITPDELGHLIDMILAGLPQEGPALAGPVDFSLTGGVSVIDFPSPQSVVIFGHDGLAESDPDFFAAFVLNEALGGGFKSLLNEEVRINRGLTYGIGTGLVTREWQPMFVGQFSSSNELVGEAIGVTQAALRDVAQNGLAPERVEAAKQNLIGAYPLRFDGNGQIAAILAGMQRQGRPLDYLTTRNASIAAVSVEDVTRVAARLLRPQALRFVVVGQPQGVSATD